MTSVTYFLANFLPYVIAVAMVTGTFGAFIGWLFWGHYPAKTIAIESQNDNLRREIRRLTA